MADSSPSSVGTFYTAADSRSPHSTAASSPVHATPCPYRVARPLPHELKQHCHIFLEEQLYSGATGLLNTLLAAGASKQRFGSSRQSGASSSTDATTNDAIVRRRRSKGVPVPPPSHLAILCTLAIHPQHTTRAESVDHQDISSLSLDYLRNLLAIVGPVNADFRTAFQFHQTTSRWGRRSARDNDERASPDLSGDASDGDDDRRDHDRVAGKMANSGGIWHRGSDFWSVVGWSFNCSALHPQRWRYWKTWLEFMIDVLVADWDERERLDGEAYEASPGSEVSVVSRKDSIVAMYINQQSGRQGTFKAILKALFADGGGIASSGFREVFEKELKSARRHEKKRKREALDLENDRFGDYYDDDSLSSGISEPPTPEKLEQRKRRQRSSKQLVQQDQRQNLLSRTTRPVKKESSFGVDNPGLVESIQLRMRMFRLISQATHCLGSPRDLTQLYEDAVATLKVLPLEFFTLFLGQSDSKMLVDTHTTLIKGLFELLLPSSHKRPHKVDPDNDAAGFLSVLMMQECFVGHPANTVALEDNAKLSIVVESSIHLLWRSNALEYSDDFDAAVRKGIDARAAKIKRKRTGKAGLDPAEELAQDVLSNSAERIQLMLDVIKLESQPMDD